MTDRKQQILDATVEIFLQEGLRGVTMRKVAERVGVSATALYRHYRGKDALLAAVITRGQHLFASYLFRSLGEPTPAERLIRTGELYIDFALEQAPYFRITFMAWGELDPKRHLAEKYEGHSPTFQFLIDRIAECLPAEASADQQRLFQIAMALWSLVHGLASLYLGGGLATQLPLPEFKGLCRGILEKSVVQLLN